MATPFPVDASQSGVAATAPEISQPIPITQDGPVLETFQEQLFTAVTVVNNQLFRMRQRFRRFAYDRPVHLLVMVAALSLASGMALRIWRTHRT